MAKVELEKNNQQSASWFGRTMMAVGITGAAFAALCCFAPFLIGGAVTAIGLGFILKDSILMGLLVVFIGIAGLGLYLTQRKHR
jgi:hypothetical protein